MNKSVLDKKDFCLIPKIKIYLLHILHVDIQNVVLRFTE